MSTKITTILSRGFLVIGCLLSYMAQSQNLQDLQMRLDPFNIVPKTPEAAGFEEYGNIGVNSSKGQPNISVPLYTINLDGLQIPISLSYDASGVKVDDIASPVGLKWTLTAGGYVYRNINGLADETSGVGLFNVGNEYFDPDLGINPDCSERDLLKNVLENHVDVTPDDFGYSFLGYSGSFHFERDGTLVEDIKSNLKIEWVNDLEFKITDARGFQFLFGGLNNIERSQTATTTLTGINDLTRSGNGISGWRLVRITSPNGNEVNFEYEEEQVQYSLIVGEVATIFTKHDCSCSGGSNSGLNEIQTNYDYTIQKIKKITTDRETIIFNYTRDEGLAVWKEKLTSVAISDKFSDFSYSYEFDYSQFSGSPRLKLDEIYKRTCHERLPHYQFEYQTGSLPAIGAKSKDLFGYYNGASNPHLIPIAPTYEDEFVYGTSANRNIHGTFIKYGTLNKIIYPTGGSSKFHYEPNNEGTNYAGGVRVAKMEDLDENDVTQRTKEYEYSGLTGSLRNYDDYGRHYQKYNAFFSYDQAGLEDCESNRFSTSDLQSNSRKSPDFYYQNIKIKTIDTQNNLLDWLEENYTNTKYGHDNSIKPYLQSRIYYLGSSTTKLKEESFGYDVVPEAEKLIDLPGKAYAGPVTSCQISGCPTVYTGYEKSFYTSISFNQNSHSTRYYGETTDFVKSELTFDSYQNVTEQKYSSSRSNEYYTNKFRYVYNYNQSKENFATLVGKNIIGVPLDSRKIYADKGVVEGYSRLMDDNGNVIQLYRLNNQYPVADDWTSESLISSNDFQLADEYDFDHGRIVEHQSLTGEVNLFIWAYDHQYLVAQIKNMSLSDFNSTYCSTTCLSNINASVDPAYIATQLANIKSSLPTDSWMTIFHYDKPMQGVSTTTDPTGITASYQYDGFGRLRQVLDNDDYLVRQVDYNYAASDGETKSISVSPSSISFGPINVGTSQTKAINVSNNGYHDVTITSVTVPTGFTYTGTLPILISPCSSTTLMIRFDPMDAGTFSGDVVITSDSENGDEAVAISGEALHTRIIGLNSTDYDFGTVPAGGCSTQTMYISNTGTGPLQVSGITLPDGYHADWSSGTVPAGSNQPVTIFFQPSAQAGYNGSVSVQSNKTGGTSLALIHGTGGPYDPSAPGCLTDN